MRSEPLRVEFVLSDFCNLNCRGCTHYSPLAKKEFVALDVLERSMRIIGSRCGDGLESAYLIGGEPLLYPHLTAAMRALRENFPTQKLYIFTNGIALPRMDAEFWEAARQLDIILAVTRYPIKFDYDKVLELCVEQRVKTEVFADRGDDNSFFRYLLDPSKKQNARVSHFKCYNRGCLSVIGDRVYPCSISACVTHLNRACGTDFRHEKGDWIDVDKLRDAADLKRLRDTPVPFCAYCILPPESAPYGPSARKASEWVRLTDGAKC